METKARECFHEAGSDVSNQRTRKGRKTKSDFFSNGTFSSDIWTNGFISIEHVTPTGKELENVRKEVYSAALEMEER